MIFSKISPNFSYEDMKRDKYYEDKKLWRNRPRLEMVLMSSGGIEQDHDCIPDFVMNEYRCKYRVIKNLTRKLY